MNNKREKTWPFLRWIESRNHRMVDARTKDGGHRRFFEKKAEAEGWRLTQLRKRGTQGSYAFDDRELREFGWSIPDAIRFALEHLRRQARASMSKRRSPRSSNSNEVG
jgi:hypothetical protein